MIPISESSWPDIGVRRSVSILRRRRYPGSQYADEGEYDIIYLYLQEKSSGEVRLRIPGRHNVLNALAAILVGLGLGLAFKTIGPSLKEFNGAKRRFHIRAHTDGVMLIDDYAHHPTEIRAVLDACGNCGING